MVVWCCLGLRQFWLSDQAARVGVAAPSSYLDFCTACKQARKEIIKGVCLTRPDFALDNPHNPSLGGPARKGQHMQVSRASLSGLFASPWLSVVSCAGIAAGTAHPHKYHHLTNPISRVLDNKGVRVLDGRGHCSSSLHPLTRQHRQWTHRGVAACWLGWSKVFSQGVLIWGVGGDAHTTHDASHHAREGHLKNTHCIVALDSPMLYHHMHTPTGHSQDQGR